MSESAKVAQSGQKNEITISQNVDIDIENGSGRNSGFTYQSLRPEARHPYPQDYQAPGAHLADALNAYNTHKTFFNSCMYSKGYYIQRN